MFLLVEFSSGEKERERQRERERGRKGGRELTLQKACRRKKRVKYEIETKQRRESRRIINT